MKENTLRNMIRNQSGNYGRNRSREPWHNTKRRSLIKNHYSNNSKNASSYVLKEDQDVTTSMVSVPVFWPGWIGERMGVFEEGWYFYQSS